MAGCLAAVRGPASDGHTPARRRMFILSPSLVSRRRVNCLAVCISFRSRESSLVVADYQCLVLFPWNVVCKLAFLHSVLEFGIKDFPVLYLIYFTVPILRAYQVRSRVEQRLSWCIPDGVFIILGNLL